MQDYNKQVSEDYVSLNELMEKCRVTGTMY